MAIGFSESGGQTAPLGRAVIGGLIAATISTLFILPSIYSVFQSRAQNVSPSLDPYDPESKYYEQA
jgi:Cu/Ag efflux pump CusA